MNQSIPYNSSLHSGLWVGCMFSVLCAFKNPINIHHLLCSFFFVVCSLVLSEMKLYTSQITIYSRPLEQQQFTVHLPFISFIKQSIIFHPHSYIFVWNIFIFFLHVFGCFSRFQLNLSCVLTNDGSSDRSELIRKSYSIPHVVPTLTFHLHVLSRALINQNTRDLIIYHAKQLVNCHIKMLCLSAET